MTDDILEFGNRACGVAGFGRDTPQAKGCRSSLRSFAERASALPRVVCGESLAAFRARVTAQQDEFRKNVLRDVAADNGIPKWRIELYIVCGVIVFAVGGLAGLIIVGAEAGLAYGFEQWMEAHDKTVAMCGLAPTPVAARVLPQPVICQSNATSRLAHLGNFLRKLFR